MSETDSGSDSELEAGPGFEPGSEPAAGPEADCYPAPGSRSSCQRAQIAARLDVTLAPSGRRLCRS